MNKTLLLILSFSLVFLPVAQADDAYKIAITPGKQPDTKAQRELIQQLPKELQALPIAFFHINPAKHYVDAEFYDISPDHFNLVVENTQNKETTLWFTDPNAYDCLTLTMVDDTTKSYSMKHSVNMTTLTDNGGASWTFAPHGTNTIPVDFTDEHWTGLPPEPKHPIVVLMTATFEYGSEDGKKTVKVNSPPTKVVLMTR